MLEPHMWRKSVQSMQRPLMRIGVSGHVIICTSPWKHSNFGCFQRVFKCYATHPYFCLLLYASTFSFSSFEKRACTGTAAGQVTTLGWTSHYRRATRDANRPNICPHPLTRSPASTVPCTKLLNTNAYIPVLFYIKFVVN